MVQFPKVGPLHFLLIFGHEFCGAIDRCSQSGKRRFRWVFNPANRGDAKIFQRRLCLAPVKQVRMSVWFLNQGFALLKQPVVETKRASH